MDLTYEDLERYLEVISTGTSLVDIDGKDILFKYPGVKCKMLARKIYDKEYIFAKDTIGLFTNKEMEDLISTRPVLTEEDKAIIKKYISEIESQKILLSKMVNVRANQDRIVKNIKEREKVIAEIEYKERAKYTMTAEARAEESRILYLCWASTYDAYMDELFWHTHEDFDNEKDLLFRQKILGEFIRFYSGISTECIRFIARSNIWRIRYVTSLKTSEQLFGRPVSEYTNDMLNLVYWSHYYQNIYEMLPEDRPPDDIIEDDTALDAYLNSYYDDKHRELLARRDKKKNKGKLGSAFSSQEVIVARTNPLYEDVKFDDPREARNKQDTVVQQKPRRRRR